MSKILTETLNFNQAGIVCESEGEDKNKKLFLQGIFIQGATKNHNNRVYPVSEIRKAVEEINERLVNFSVCGELDHPTELTINADRISHKILKMWMDGTDGHGKLEIIPTPCGQIARTLVESGVKIGVSSRGSGNVDPSGHVSDFQIQTVDLVINASAPDAYPKPMFESLLSRRGRVIHDLASSVAHDPKAQKFLQKELLDWIKKL